MSVIIKGKVISTDVQWYDGVNETASRKDTTGGFINGTPVGQEVDVFNVYGGTYTKSTIDLCLQTIGSLNRTLIFRPGTWVIDANLTIGSNFTLRLPAGVTFEISTGITLTINGYIFSDSETISSGGTLTYERSIYNPVLYPLLSGETGVTNYGYPVGDVRRHGAIGDGSTDDTIALQALFDSMESTGRCGYLPKGDYSHTGLTISEMQNFCLKGDGFSNNGANMAVLQYDGSAGSTALSMTGVIHCTMESVAHKYGSAAPDAYIKMENGTNIIGSIDFHKVLVYGNGVIDGSLGIEVGTNSVVNNSDFNWGRVEVRNIQDGIKITPAQSVLHHFEYLRFVNIGGIGLNMISGGLVKIGTINASDVNDTVIKIRGGSAQIGAHQFDNVGVELSSSSAAAVVFDIASDVAGGQVAIVNNLRVHPNYTGTHVKLGASTSMIAIGGRMTSGTIDVTGTQNGGDAYFQGIAGQYNVNFSTSGFGYYETNKPMLFTSGSASAFGGNVTRSGKNLGLNQVLAPVYSEEYFNMPLSRASGSTIDRTIPDDAIPVEIHVIVESIGSATGSDHMELNIGGVKVGDIEIGTAGPRTFKFTTNDLHANDTDTVPLGDTTVLIGLDTTHRVRWALASGSISNVRTATGRLIIKFIRESIGAIGIDS